MPRRTTSAHADAAQCALLVEAPDTTPAATRPGQAEPTPAPSMLLETYRQPAPVAPTRSASVGTPSSWARMRPHHIGAEKAVQPVLFAPEDADALFGPEVLF